MFPILSIYETPISKVSIGDLLLLIIFPFVSLKYVVGVSDSINRIQVSVLVFVIYILVAFGVQLLSGYPAEFISTMRYVFFLLVLVFGFDYFDSEKGLKYITIISIIVSIWLTCQFVTFYFFSYILPWKLPFLPVIDNLFVEVVNEPYFMQYYRPTSVFYEPTHFVQYIIVALVANVVIPKYASYKTRLIFVSAILMSASSLGFLSLILIFLYKIFFINGFRIKPIYVIIFFFLLLLLVPLMSEIEYFSFIITRVFDTETGGLGPAVGYRFNSLELLLSNNDQVKWIFGSGRGSEKAYFTGVFYLLNSIGLIGLFLYFWLIFNVAKSSDGFGKMLIVVVFLLSFGSELVANYGLLFYLPFCRYVEKNNS